VVHALAIAVGFGLLFMLAVLGGGRSLYRAMGGSGASLTAALTCSTVVFSGAVLIWVFNSLANVIRGTGNMAVPAVITSAGAAALIPLSPCLIFGWGLSVQIAWPPSRVLVPEGDRCPLRRPAAADWRRVLAPVEDIFCDSRPSLAGRLIARRRRLTTIAPARPEAEGCYFLRRNWGCPGLKSAGHGRKESDRWVR
jgi:hypothetical protein